MGYEYSGHIEHPSDVEAWKVIREVIRGTTGVSILRDEPSSMALRLRPEEAVESTGWNEDVVVELDGDELYVVVYAVNRTQREEFLNGFQSRLHTAGLNVSFEEL